MNLLINDSPLIVLPHLAMIIGPDEALLLQQLYFRLKNQGVKREGETWYCQSYERWQMQIPFWGISKIKKLFLKLEKMDLVISTQKYNTFYVDRTKWYRINYKKLDTLLIAHEVPNGTVNVSADTLPKSQLERLQGSNEAPTKRKEIEDVKEDITESQYIDEIIDYLNKKAHKAYKKNKRTNRRLIKARLDEGFTVEDCKIVIDEQVSRWLFDLHMNQFLRPSTLFHPDKFEGYLMAGMKSKGLLSDGIKPVVLDFSAGEEW